MVFMVFTVEEGAEYSGISGHGPLMAGLNFKPAGFLIDFHVYLLVQITWARYTGDERLCNCKVIISQITICTTCLPLSCHLD